MHAGFFASRLADEQRAQERLTAALELSREISDFEGESRAILWLTLSLARIGRFDQALELAQSGLELCRSHGDEVGATLATQLLALVPFGRGDDVRAAAYAEETLERLDRQGDWATRASTLQIPLAIAVSAGDLDAMTRHAEALLVISSQVHFVQYEAMAKVALARVAAERGERVRSRELTLEGLALAHRGHTVLAAGLYAQGAAISATLGQPTEAVQMLGARRAWLENTRYSPGWLRLDTLTRANDMCLAVLGEEAYANALDAGRAYGIHDAAERLIDALASLPA
jgi:tetratricopeptide (TPR) repeat protein